MMEAKLLSAKITDLIVDVLTRSFGSCPRKRSMVCTGPCYFVSDIIYGPLNVLFSSARPIALNYHASRRAAMISAYKTRVIFIHFALYLLTELMVASVKPEGLALAANPSNSTIFFLASRLFTQSSVKFSHRRNTLMYVISR